VHYRRDRQKVSCPQCGRPADRIRRRLIDRIVSLFTPIRRYRCWHFSCEWEGNLAVGSSVDRVTE